MFLVNEIFTSFQGEGLKIGVPSLFVRLGKCNLKCTWCDTKYSWNEYKEYSLEILVNSVRYILNSHTEISNLVITGGEPLLQEASLIEFIHQIKDLVQSIEIETNGTVSSKKLLGQSKIFFNVSPKVGYYNTAILQEFRRSTHTIFKFVCKTPEDVRSVVNLAINQDILRSQILISPEAVTCAEVSSVSKDILPEVLRAGFRLTTRLHVILWDRLRGV